MLLPLLLLVQLFLLHTWLRSEDLSQLVWLDSVPLQVGIREENHEPFVCVWLRGSPILIQILIRIGTTFPMSVVVRGYSRRCARAVLVWVGVSREFTYHPHLIRIRRIIVYVVLQ